MGFLHILAILINTRLLQSKCKTPPPALCYSGAQIRQMCSCKKGQLQLVLAGVCFHPERAFSWSQCDTPFLHFHQPVLNDEGTICAGAMHWHCFYSVRKYWPPVLSVCHFHKHEIHYSHSSLVEELNWRDLLPKVGNVYRNRRCSLVCWNNRNEMCEVFRKCKDKQ